MQLSPAVVLINKHQSISKSSLFELMKRVVLYSAMDPISGVLPVTTLNKINSL